MCSSWEWETLIESVLLCRASGFDFTYNQGQLGNACRAEHTMASMGPKLPWICLTF